MSYGSGSLMESNDYSYLERLSVLYVEDDYDSREQCSQFLKRFTRKLLVAETGNAGLALFREHRPAIILTDILMPVMSGLEMIKRVREFDQDVHIVIMTAHDHPRYLLESIDLGIDKYVVKPADPSELLNALLVCAEKLRRERELCTAATIDVLTGLINRRELKKRYETLHNLADRHGSNFSVIMIDIDHFKRINDVYGHNGGDMVLKKISATLLSSLRLEDVCGRWGGEEFLVYLPSTDTDKALLTAEKLRKAIADLTTSWDGTHIQTTISLGVAQYHPGQSMEECLKQADDAMYRAKLAGRNQVKSEAGNRYDQR